MLKPLRDAWRSLIRRPGYFAIAVCSLAVALGLATTVIAHLDSLVHPDFGTPNQSRLHLGLAWNSRTPLSSERVARELGALPGVEQVGLVRMSSPETSVRLGVHTSTENVFYATPEAFETVGGAPVVGRWFLPNERDGAPVALITEDAWRRRLGGDANLANIRLVINGAPHTVVGVVPRGLPPFIRLSSGPGSIPQDVILPAGTESLDGAGVNLAAIVRVRRGASKATLDSAVAALAHRLQNEAGPRARAGATLGALDGIRLFRFAGYQRAMVVAVAIIVLIACANVAALMLARALARRRDQALRLALGAERRHIVASVVAEVAVIGVVGAVAGLVIGYWSMQLLAAVTPPELPWLGFARPHWSPWVFGGLLAVVMVAVAIASIVPAVFVGRIAPIEQMKENSGNTTGRPARTFQVLIVGELALSLILLFGAVLVARSASEVAGFDFGYEPRGVAAVSARVHVTDNPAPPPATLGRFTAVQVAPQALGDVVARLRNEPGVRNAAWARIGDDRTVIVSDESARADRQLVGALSVFAGPDLFATLGLRIVSGRDFVDADRSGDGAVILDELAAARLFQGSSPIGKLVKFGSSRSMSDWVRVVGVVPAARHALPNDPAVAIKPTVYLARLPVGPGVVRFGVRADRGALDVPRRAATIAQDLLPPGTLVSTNPWLTGYDVTLVTRRFAAGMFLTLSVASLVLAAAGLFGVLSYAVNARMREFAVRVALGAQRAHVVRLVARDGLVMVLGGTAIGAAVAMYAAFALWEWLWGVYPVDPLALVTAEALLILVTALGALVPALRATQADPVEVLRAT